MWGREKHQPSREDSMARKPGQGQTQRKQKASAARRPAAASLKPRAGQAVAPHMLGKWRWRNAPCLCSPASSNRCSRPMRSRPIARQKSGNLKAPTRQQAVSAWSDSIQVRPAPWEAQLINLLDGRLKSFAFGTKGRKIQLGHVWANLLAECGQIQLCERAVPVGGLANSLPVLRTTSARAATTFSV